MLLQQLGITSILPSQSTQPFDSARWRPITQWAGLGATLNGIREHLSKGSAFSGGGDGNQQLRWQSQGMLRFSLSSKGVSKGIVPQSLPFSLEDGTSAETPTGRLARSWHCPLQGPVAGKHHLKCLNFSPVFLWLAYLCKCPTTIPSIFITNDRGIPFYLGGLAGLMGNCPTHLSTLVISMTHELAFLTENHLCKVNWPYIIFQTQCPVSHTAHRK